MKGSGSMSYPEFVYGLARGDYEVGRRRRTGEGMEALIRRAVGKPTVVLVTGYPLLPRPVDLRP